MEVEVATEPTFSASPPRVLFEGRYMLSPFDDQSYDITPDGMHFVMNHVDQESQRRLRVVTNRFAELERLVPSR